MSLINLDGRKFSPIKNSEAGRVASDAVFIFEQSGDNFSAHYKGQGFTDDHLIGHMTSPNKADLVYHSRSEDSALEVGEAKAVFDVDDKGKLTISMQWCWLSGDKQSGTSFYGEL